VLQKQQPAFQTTSNQRFILGFLKTSSSFLSRESPAQIISLQQVVLLLLLHCQLFFLLSFSAIPFHEYQN